MTQVLRLLLSLFVMTTVYAKKCTYTTYSWNINSKSAVNFREVIHDYEGLTSLEKDRVTGCTVCQEDQREIFLPKIHSFKVCKYIALDVERVLVSAIYAGKDIKSVTGYRVGRTRGEADEKGNRTEFSNHSFGIALDVNAEYNGLYDHCRKFSKSCRLRKGGIWQSQNPLSLHKSDAIVKNFNAIGLKWGGEIQGWQKDFMHFSPTGY